MLNIKMLSGKLGIYFPVYPFFLLLLLTVNFKNFETNIQTVILGFLFL